jgi:hypothetical protein
MLLMQSIMTRRRTFHQRQPMQRGRSLCSCCRRVSCFACWWAHKSKIKSTLCFYRIVSYRQEALLPNDTWKHRTYHTPVDATCNDINPKSHGRNAFKDRGGVVVQKQTFKIQKFSNSRTSKFVVVPYLPAINLCDILCSVLQYSIRTTTLAHAHCISVTIVNLYMVVPYIYGNRLSSTTIAKLNLAHALRRRCCFNSPWRKRESSRTPHLLLSAFGRTHDETVGE